MLEEADLDDEDSGSSDNEENVHLLGSLYKVTAKGAIVPLIGTVGTQRAEENTRQAMKKVLIRKENKVCVECGRAPVKYFSVNLGVFLCAVCQKIHQQLGVGVGGAVERRSPSAKCTASLRRCCGPSGSPLLRRSATRRRRRSGKTGFRRKSGRRWTRLRVVGTRARTERQRGRRS